MPELGESRRGNEIGKSARYHFLWSACEKCGEPRWVMMRRGEPRNHICLACSIRLAREVGRGMLMNPRLSKGPRPNITREKNPKWKGGAISAGQGYMQVLLEIDDPYFVMANTRGYIMEHRLVMARHLGRCLLSSEYVHHKDGNRANNDVRNLELVSRANHAIYNQLCHNCELRKEIRLLRWQIKELAEALQGKLEITIVGGHNG